MSIVNTNIPQAQRDFGDLNGGLPANRQMLRESGKSADISRSPLLLA